MRAHDDRTGSRRTRQLGERSRTGTPPAPHTGAAVLRAGRSPSAESLIALQSAAGNAAVQRAVARQRSLRAFESATRAMGEELPFRREMEDSFGADLAGVRSYPGVGGLGATAATHGEQIAFSADRPSKHTVAHEVAHVMQHRRAGVTAGSATSVSERTSPAEREARRVAGLAAAGGEVSIGTAAPNQLHLEPGGGGGVPPPPPGGGRPPPPPVGGAHAPAPITGYAALDPVHRALVRKQATTKCSDDIPRFEMTLGRFLATHAESLAGAKAMTAAIVATADVVARRAAARVGQAGDDDATARATEFAGLWGVTKRSVTGAVPHTVSSITKTAAGGNLREQMALIYDIIRSGGLAKVLDTAATEHAAGTVPGATHQQQARGQDWTNAGLSATKLDELHGTAQAARAAPGWDEKKLSHLVFARTDLVTKQDRTTSTREQRKKLLKGYSISPNEVEAIGDEPLSKRELRAAFPEQYTKLKAQDLNAWRQLSEGERQQALAGVVGTGSLGWKPGYTTYQLGPALRKEAEGLGVRLLGGLSGSSDMYFKAAGYLGLDVAGLQRVRLAALGTMLPARDHSFHEVMIVGREYGLPYTAGAHAYLVLPPLSANDVLVGTTRTRDGAGNTVPLPGFWRTGAGLDALAGTMFPVAPGSMPSGPRSTDLKQLAGTGARFGHYNKIISKVDGYAKLTAKADAAAAQGKAKAVAGYTTKRQRALGEIRTASVKWLADNATRPDKDQRKTAIRSVLALVDRDEATIARGGGTDRKLDAAERKRLLAPDFAASFEDVEAGFANLTTVKMTFNRNLKNVKAASGDVSEATLRTQLEQAGDLKKVATDADHVVAAMSEPVKDVLATAARQQSGEPMLAELAAIWQYTTEVTPGSKFYDKVNKALSGNGKLTEDEIRLVRLGISGIRKLQQLRPYVGTVWRGEGGKGSRYTVGTTKTYSKFVSTSKRKKQAYFNKPGYPVQLRIDNTHSGVDVSSLSQYMLDEGEVLFPPGAKFRVVAASHTKDATGLYPITLQET